MPEWISAIANAVVAFGLLFTICQLRLAKKLARTQFEDTLAREYREIIAKLPSRAMLGEELSNAENVDYLDEFYQYIDLCNEQVFLRTRNRITFSTWVYWRDGITANLARPAFKTAWERIKQDPNSFEELKQLLHQPKKDPKPGFWSYLKQAVMSSLVMPG